MRNKWLIKLGSLASTISLAGATVACNSKEIETTDKIAFDKNVTNKKTLEVIKEKVALANLLNLYNVKDFHTFAEMNKKYKDEFSNSSSALYKDSYLAFQYYAKNQVDKDKFFFYSKFQSDWLKKVPTTQASKLSTIQQGDIPSEEIFKILWNAEGTGLRKEIEKMLVVKQYLTLSNEDDFKKIDKDFDYSKEQYYKYDKANYYLNKLALDKKLVQLWEVTPDDSASNVELEDALSEIRNKSNSQISNAVTFNKMLKDTKNEKDTLDLNSAKKYDYITNNFKTQSQENVYRNNITKLKSYKGFHFDFSKYNIGWTYDNLKNQKPETLYGFYSPQEQKIKNPDLSNFTVSDYVPYNNGKLILAYLNQVAPVGKTIDVITDKEKNKTEKVETLSFENTIYAKSIDRLCFIYYLNDNKIYDQASSALEKVIGYKVDANYNKLKDSLKGSDLLNKDSSSNQGTK